MFTPTQGLRTTNEGINGPNVVDKQASVVTKILVLGCKFRTLQAIFLNIINLFFDHAPIHALKSIYNHSFE